jgi:hypothetical protein
VKDGGYNLNAMIFVLKYLVNCETLGLQQSFNDTCFGHVYSKAYQYAIINEKMYRSLIYVSIKAVQAYLQKYITWPQKSKKGRRQWTKACVEIGIHPKKLNTPMKTRYTLRSFLLCEKN